MLACFFVAFSIIAPYLTKAYYTGLFAADVKNAEAFLEQLKSCINKLAVFEEGTSFSLKVKPINAWRIEAKDKTIFLEIKPEKPEILDLDAVILKEKVLSEIQLKAQPLNEGQLVVEKKDGVIKIQ